MKQASGGQSGIDQSGQSLSHMWELVSACLDAREAASVVEIGGRAGELTRELAARAVVRGGAVAAIEPSPALELEELAARRPELELIPETSLDALRRIEVPDALIVDGDHARRDFRCCSCTTSAGLTPAATPTTRPSGFRRVIDSRWSRTPLWRRTSPPWRMPASATGGPPPVKADRATAC